MTKTLHGQGATPERLAKSKIDKKVRGTTDGGIPNAYGHEDQEHCALDVILEKGYIEQDQHDAGYALRGIYFTFTSTGRWIDEGGKAHEGEMETDADRARSRFNKALASINKDSRAIVRTVCVDETVVPANYTLIRLIQYGLDDLIKFFKGV